MFGYDQQFINACCLRDTILVMKLAQFLAHTKEILEVQKSSNEWLAFAAFCENEDAVVWYKLASRFYLAGIGRTFSREIVSRMVLLFVVAAYAKEARCENISKEAWKQLNALFSEDMSLPRIQRFFSECAKLYNVPEKGVSAELDFERIFLQQPGKSYLSKLLQTMGRISGKDDVDLMAELDSLVRAMLRQRNAVRIKKTAAVLYENKSSDTLPYFQLKMLRDAANILSITGTLAPIPDVPETDLTLRNPVIQEIRDAVVKFSADSVVLADTNTESLRMEKSLAEIQEIFKDFGMSTNRKKYLRLFMQGVESFSQL